MSGDMGYIVAGWAISLVVLAGYAATLVTRGRRLSRQVPPERRRWTS
jgi:hypothetical protein